MPTEILAPPGLGYIVPVQHKVVNMSSTAPMQTGVAQTSMAIQSKQTTLPHFARSRTEPTKSQGPTEADVAPMTQTQIPDHHDYNTAAHNVKCVGDQGSDDHVFKFPGVDLNDRAKAALIRHNSSDVDTDVSGTFVYEAGERINWEEMEKHHIWARENGGIVLTEAACADGKSSAMMEIYTKRRVEVKDKLSLIVLIPRQTLVSGIHAKYKAAGVPVFNYLTAQNKTKE